MPECPVSTIVVDDESLARSLLATFVRRDPDLLLIGECADGQSAYEEIERTKPDLVFLDVQMPGIDGVSLARKLSGLPHVPYFIFVTAYDQYAVEAFEVQALDYLVKPLQKARFFAAVERAKQAIRSGEMLQLTKRLIELGEGAGASSTPPQAELLVRSGDRVERLVEDDILWVDAANQYAEIHTAERTYVVSETLGNYARRLDPARFFRVHRSTLVNGSVVSEVTRRRNGTHLLTLQNGREVVVARSKSAMIPDILRAARTHRKAAAQS